MTTLRGAAAAGGSGSGVLLLRITLEHIEPEVWREIVVPETFDFWALHCAIQDAMGWQDCHLHEFHIPRPGEAGALRIGIPDEDEFDPDARILPGWNLPIAPYFPRIGSRIPYLYDFGDDWSHVVELCERRAAEPRERLPRCLGGARACPPEDCGGPHTYSEFLEAIRDPRHEDHASLLEWVGGSFDPEAFDPGKVKFRDPDKYWRELFGPPLRRTKRAAKKTAKKAKRRSKKSR